MADPNFGIYTKNADIVVRAGAKANATAITVAETDKYVLTIEGYVNSVTHYNWSDAYAALNVDVRGLLTEAGACLCAINVIAYDPSGFTSLEEASFIVDTLWARAQQALGKLADQEVKTFMVGA